MPDLPALADQLQLEQVKFFSILLGWLFIIIDLDRLIGDVKLDFLLALDGFIVFLLGVNLLVEDLVSEADNAPPQSVVRHFVKLLRQFVEHS